MRLLGLRREPLEGDFIETHDNLIFDVKGHTHPNDRVVAFVRYVPNSTGSRRRCNRRYIKIYELGERWNILRRNFPDYVFYDEILDREMQGPRRSDILMHYLPAECYAQIACCASHDALMEKCRRAVDTLRELTSLPQEAFGISGSLLVGLHQADSDIDIVAYGAAAGTRLVDTLRQVLLAHPALRPYDETRLLKLFQERGVSAGLSFNEFCRHEERKVLQGTFDGSPYFIRCVKTHDEYGIRYGERRYRRLGQATIEGRVISDSESIYTPCRYELADVTVLAGGRGLVPLEAVSFRGRFTEQAVVGEHVRARGTIERVQWKQDEYLRLVVGESSGDFLVAEQGD